MYHLCIICLFVKIGSFSCNSCRNLWSLEDPKTQSSPVSRPIPNLGTTGTTEGWLSKVRRRTRWFDGAIAKSTVQFWQCWSCEISLRKSMVLDGKGWFWQDVEWWQFSKDSLDKGLDVFRCSVLTMFLRFSAVRCLAAHSGDPGNTFSCYATLPPAVCPQLRPYETTIDVNLDVFERIWWLDGSSFANWSTFKMYYSALPVDFHSSTELLGPNWCLSWYPFFLNLQSFLLGMQLQISWGLPWL